MLPADVSKEDFLSKYRVSSETVGPVVAADIKINAFYAVGIALILIFFYIFMRFRYWQYGFGAVMSLAPRYSAGYRSLFNLLGS